MTVKRFWHGWTSPENADTYQQLLLGEILPGIAAKNIRGYLGVELVRRELDNETEFVVIMRFESLQSVIDFQGDDYSLAYVPDAARKVLSRWDERAAHYELVATRDHQ